MQVRAKIKVKNAKVMKKPIVRKEVIWLTEQMDGGPGRTLGCEHVVARGLFSKETSRNYS